MKKTINNILFAALIVFAAASCQKELGSEPQSEGLRTITCYMETPSDTKGGGATLPEWHTGDQIWISNGTSSETKTLEAGDIDGNKVTLSTSLSGTLYAVCPASAQNGVTGGKICIKIPTSTDGAFANAHIAVAQGDGTLSFKNAVTILNIATSDEIAAVNISSTANIAGEFNVAYGPSLTLEAGASQAKSVTLTSSTGGARYVAIAPGTAFNTVTFTAIKTATNWAVRTSTSTNSAAINTIYTIGNVADGSSWTYTGDSNGSLWGQFSVSADKKVRFSKGNLQATYSGSAYTWDFAEHQYDYVGDAAGNTSIDSQTDGAVVDLFGWTKKDKYNDGIKQYGINTSETASDYGDSVSDDLSDWGTLKGSGWRTPSGGDSGEWNYLLSSSGRGSGDTCFKCPVTVAGKTNCLVIAPDCNTQTISESYTADEWAIAEKVYGFVCLPAAGYRSVSSMGEVGTTGYYWSSTPRGDEEDEDDENQDAYYLVFPDYYPGPVYPSGKGGRSNGRSVRLVTE